MGCVSVNDVALNSNCWERISGPLSLGRIVAVCEMKENGKDYRLGGCTSYSKTG